MIKVRLTNGVALAAMMAAVIFAHPAHAFEPCTGGGNKLSFKATISSAATTKLVPGLAGKNIHVCGLAVQNVGSAGTWKLQTGTSVSTPCDTTPLDMTPAFGGTDTAVATAGNGNVYLGFAGDEVANTGDYLVGGDLCLVSGGTITDIWVYGTYIQQ